MRNRENIFGDLKNGVEYIYNNNISHYIKSFNDFSNEYKPLLKNKKEQESTQAWDFSIFNILRFTKPEIHLHTPLIKELLDINGTHGQKDLFFNHFTKMIKPKSYEKYKINPEFFYLKEEKYVHSKIGIGYIDIVIESKNPINPFVLIIENKWNSFDSCDNQMLKYRQYYIDQNNYSDEQILLIYLTKEGLEPNRVKGVKFKSVLESNSFLKISYKNQIIHWLEESLSECKSIKVKETINQYINYLRWKI